MTDLRSWARDLRRYADLAFEKALRPRLAGDPTWPVPARVAAAALGHVRMALEVTAVLEETKTARTLRFRRLDGALPPFRAGQYVSLEVTVDGVRTNRPYSISSRPGVDHLDLTVRETPGAFVSRHLVREGAVGERFAAFGPIGGFYHEPLIDTDEVLFVAGGSGITPFMSMIRDLDHRGWPIRVALVYGSRSPDDVIFGEELARLAEAQDRFSLDLVISEPPKGYRGHRGFLDRKVLGRIERIRERSVYVCGPGALYDLVLGELQALEVPGHRIRREIYGPPADVTREPGWPESVPRDARFSLEVEGRGTLEAAASEPVLVALERAGLVVPARCRSGECGACRVKILAGRVFEPSCTRVRESDRANGYAHACTAYPVSDLAVRLPKP